MDLTVVVPVFNEEESLPELVEWIDSVAGQEKYRYEIILVDDGSRDSSWKVIKEIIHPVYPHCEG